MNSFPFGQYQVAARKPEVPLELGVPRGSVDQDPGLASGSNDVYVRRRACWRTHALVAACDKFIYTEVPRQEGNDTAAAAAA